MRAHCSVHTGAWRTQCQGSLRKRLVSTRIRGVQIRAFVQDGPGSGTPEGIPVPLDYQNNTFPQCPPLSPCQVDSIAGGCLPLEIDPYWEHFSVHVQLSER